MKHNKVFTVLTKENMGRRLNKIFCLILMLAMALLMSSCGKTGKIVLDYADAESFEAALDSGEDLEGKTLSFAADEIHPQSAYGYNIWAGKKLNFVSDRNPNVKEGDIVKVQADIIENKSGSWIIHYKKIKNAEVGETTISSSGEDEKVSSKLPENNEIPQEKTDLKDDTAQSYRSNTSDLFADTEKEAAPKPEPVFEIVGGNIVGFKEYSEPRVSAYVAVKNTNDYNIIFEDTRFEYQDGDGKLLAVDDGIQCIPKALKPGQTGYIYSYYFDISNLDLSNDLKFVPDIQIAEANNFYEIEVSDVSFTKDSYYDIKIIARGVNNTQKERSFVTLGAVLFDKDNNVVGFCDGYEDFAEGQNKAFEISGFMMSENYEPSSVDHVEVYIQGNDWF